ncbi:TetR/AcrR family transcriptional regulator [Demequina soli]|uniref:TetR/AcrR family transcriptional regulator n=1 Tax=Demequina soli TaxID=1638987 RepID=UPI00147176ED|nr:TetR/AcrR family transcriptional regulator [Demequina soli]
MSDSAADRPRAGRGDYRAYHARLVEAAFAVFDEQGIEAPLSQVAERAQVGEATFYRHFPSRDELLVELHDIASDHVERAIVAVLQREQPDMDTRLDEFFSVAVGTLARHRSYPQLAARHGGMRPTNPVAAATAESLRALVADGQAAGLLAPDVLPSDLIAVILGAGMLAADANESNDFVWRRLLAIGRRGLAAQGSPDREGDLRPVAPPPA